MNSKTLAIAAMYAAGSMASMPRFSVKDDSTNVPGARFARFHDGPKPKKEPLPRQELPVNWKKERAKMLKKIRTR